MKRSVINTPNSPPGWALITDSNVVHLYNCEGNYRKHDTPLEKFCNEATNLVVSATLKMALLFIYKNFLKDEIIVHVMSAWKHHDMHHSAGS